MTTDNLDNAMAFAKAVTHEGDDRAVLLQAKCACITLAKEVARLRAILAAYVPTTADGKQCREGDEVWFPGEPEPLIVAGWNATNKESGAEIDQCYSTRDAAEKARTE